MSKIIFFTDLHHGGNLLARYDEDVSIYGEQWGLPLLRGLITYAESTPRTTLIHGGDEVTFKKEINRGPNELPYQRRKAALRQYLANARDISNAAIYSRVYLGRTIGNHDPIKDLDKLGINRTSHIFSRGAIPNTDIIICQPRFRREKGKGFIFSYDPDHIIDLIEKSNSENLVLSAHWAWDRKKMGISGKGYQYEDNTDEIRTYLDEKLNAGSLNSVLTLHGHSHRFRMSGREEFATVTMPAISQNDYDMIDLPCGIFAEITINDATGRLSIAFKQLRLEDASGEKIIVQKIKDQNILNYRRGQKPRGFSLSCRQ